MKSIIAFGASSSNTSINKQLATLAANKTKDTSITVLDLNDFDLPIYSAQQENEHGIPEDAKRFKQHILQANGIVISVAEHNGNFTAAFKNLYDWMSRIDRNIFNDLPMLLLSTSPGKMAGSSVMAIAKNGFPRMGAQIIAEFSLPSFQDNFSAEGLKDQNLENELDVAVAKFQAAL